MSQSIVEHARRHGSPLRQGGEAIFVWQGEGPAQINADFCGWGEGDRVEMEWLAENEWAYRVELPQDAYMEYVFYVDGERTLDPLNRHRTSNGIDEKLNNYFYMPAARPTSYAFRRPDVPRGQVSSFTLGPSWLFANGQRKVHFYQPPVEDPVPLVVVWDGAEYNRRVHLPTIVDNLLADGCIQPAALAMIENAGPGRGAEYMCSDATIGMLAEVLLPAAYEHLNLIDLDQNPGAFGVAGASAGGLMALYTGLRMPQYFGKVLAQSGAYTLRGWDMVVWDLLELADPGSLKIWQDAGRFETLVDCNRRMAARLAEKGFEAQYHEYSGGHNYPAWRDEIPKGLEFLFGKEENREQGIDKREA